MNFIMVPTIIGIVTLGIYKLFELFARRRERMMLIEKLDPSQLVSNNPGDFRLASMTSGAMSFGCLLSGLGLGLLVGFLISFSANLDENWESKSVIYGGSVLLFGGIGLITSVVVQRRLERKK